MSCKRESAELPRDRRSERPSPGILCESTCCTTIAQLTVSAPQTRFGPACSPPSHPSLSTMTMRSYRPRNVSHARRIRPLARVADVIETLTGIRYGQTQTWTLLRERLGWSRQRPARRAIERDDEAIATWVKQDWPRIKKRAAPRRLDHLPRRERVLPAPPGERDLGAQGPHPRAATPLLLDPVVDVGCAGLPTRRQRSRPDVPDQRGLV